MMKYFLLYAACGVFVALAGTAAAQLPTAQFGVIEEDFDVVVVPTDSIDQRGTRNEVIRRTNGADPTNFAWGGYDADTGDTGASAVMFYMNCAYDATSPDPEYSTLCFVDFAHTVGSYAYTVFDNDGGDANNNVPSAVLDMSGPGAKVIISSVQHADTGVAILLRTGPSLWYQSSSKILAQSPGEWRYAPVIVDVEYALDGESAVAWYLLSGTYDMNQVDDSGEMPLTLGAEATPNFENVSGVGVIITSTVGTSTGFSGLHVTNLRLEGPAYEKPASARTWMLYQ